MNTSSRLNHAQHSGSACTRNLAILRQQSKFIIKLKALSKIAGKLEPEKFKCILENQLDAALPQISFQSVKQELQRSSSKNLLSDLLDSKCSQCLSLLELGSISKLVKSPKKLKYFKKMSEHHRLQNQNSFILDSLTEQECNQRIQLISAGQIEISSSKWVSLSESLYKGQHINNEYSMIPILGLPFHEIKNEKFLRERICALANLGGGLIIGGTEEREKLEVKGFSPNIFKYLEYEEILGKIRKQIQPPITLWLQFYPVLNFMSDNQGNSIETDEPQKICLRIVVNVQYPGYLHFTSISTKGFHDIFSIHYLPMNKKENQFNFSPGPVEIELHKIYPTLLHKFAHRAQEMHKNQQKQVILSHLNQIKWPKGQNSNQNFVTQSLQVHQTQNFIQGRQEGQPVFKYRQSSLIIVGSQKKNCFIEMFRNSLRNQKKKFILVRPFEKYLDKGSRVVWFFSYEDKYEIMRQFIKKCDKGKNFTLIPITETVRLPKKKINKDMLGNILMKFSEIYPEEKVKVEEGVHEALDHSKVECFYMLFPNYQTSILGFCLLETIHIKPYFANKKQIHKIKGLKPYSSLNAHKGTEIS